MSRSCFLSSLDTPLIVPIVLRNLSLTASIQLPQLDNSVMRAALSDWRLVGGFRATTGPWLTIRTGADIALNGQAGAQRANQLRDDP